MIAVLAKDKIRLVKTGSWLTLKSDRSGSLGTMEYGALAQLVTLGARILGWDVIPQGEKPW